MAPLDDLLHSYRDSAVTEREKGTYFERLARAYLKTDPIQVEEYSEVWSWADWAADNGWIQKDLVIDLVAKLRNEDGFPAIQCKFYQATHRIQKSDIDSFISASVKAPFARRVIIDTTEVPCSIEDQTSVLVRRGRVQPVLDDNIGGGQTQSGKRERRPSGKWDHEP